MEDQNPAYFAPYNPNLTQRVCGSGANTGPILTK